ncbi:ATP-dependent RNA helicase DDX1-like isoform X1 [Hydractinia symbiolongicarpus]|uniref:ATP-dependent RNA helicase DDX1-like isoform X1 n=2 Tax=Hydractinia symbiolongicarpus TaxID=13093 RepID=UPI00254F9361|nr:ATP-dependent RNA helicase DDX1-like isoform X1 [Hydractinia symbiolongicarpus]XP_057291401.1 ATP-dependent RNA helicase DDX1-like isoform X1 [Hydractinia symbiolongicarpus]
MAGHFSEFGMLPEVVKGIEDIGWLLPTDIQAEAIPLILGGGDVLMAAETGSGKTGAFCLPVIQIVYENLVTFKGGKKSTNVNTKGKWEMSKFDRDPSFAISEDGLLCQAREQKQWQGARSNYGVSKGNYYYEATVTDEGLCRIGFSTDSAVLDVGIDGESYGFGGTGKKSHKKQFDTYGKPFGKDDVLGCYLNLEFGTIKYSKNGQDFGRAFVIDENLYERAFFASVTLKNAELKFNFGDTPFAYPPSSDYVGLSQAKDKVVSKKLSGPTKFTNICSPAALIMEPSRELATQTHDQISLFKKYMPDPKLKNVVLVGGQNSREQLYQLEKGVDIVTGTPGKIDDFVSTGKLKLDQVRFLVFDEVDGLLAQNQGKLIETLYQQCPKMSSDGKRLQLVVCSATLHNFDVKKLAQKIMHYPTWIDLKGQDSVPDTVHHVVCHVDPKEDTAWHFLKPKIRTDAVHAKDDTHPSSGSAESFSEGVKILKGEYVIKAIRHHKMDQGIIFCRTKLDCDNLERYLNSRSNGNELSCVCLHGDRNPKERTGNLEAFKNKSARFLICTDVAARGLDIKGVPFVINVTLPDEKANYVHRIGRVGRADRMGLALSLVSTCREKVWYHKCESRGRNCNNTRLLDKGGCTIWYDEKRYYAEIEEHLGETISQVKRDMVVPVNEFDGKVVYGEKRKQRGSNFSYHTAELQPAVKELAALEKQVQLSYLQFVQDWHLATS